MAKDDNPLPEFFRLLGNAFEASDEVDSFDLDFTSQYQATDWQAALTDQKRHVDALVDYVLEHGEAIKWALVEREQ